MQAIHAALTANAPAEDREATIAVEPFARLLVGPGLQRSVSVAFGAVALVLLIACANVANLLLAKGATRRRELAVRAALGAGRYRLVGQLFTESLVLCLLGGVAGIAVADLLIRVATPLLAESIPFTAAVTLDVRVLAFAGAIALGVALLAGTLPAMQTAFGNLAETLNRGSRGSSGAHSTMRRVIVIGEVALSLVLVSGALLLLQKSAEVAGTRHGRTHGKYDDDVGGSSAGRLSDAAAGGIVLSGGGREAAGGAGRCAGGDFNRIALTVDQQWRDHDGRRAGETGARAIQTRGPRLFPNAGDSHTRRAAASPAGTWPGRLE